MSPIPGPLSVATTAVAVILSTSAAAQTRFAELPVTEHFGALPSGTALAAGDFDGDGIDDLVLGAEDRSRLFLGDGRGHYTETAGRLPPHGGTARYPQRLHAADLDGDNDLDLVGGLTHARLPCFGGFGGVPMLLRNDGAGTFGDASAALGGWNPLTEPVAIATGDVDGDGDRDLVFGTRAVDPFGFDGLAAQTLLYLNDGLGGFTDVTATRLPLWSEVTQDLVLVDVDGDGDLDLVLGSAPGDAGAQPGASLWLNDGTGSYSDATAARLPAGGHGAVAAVDIDGDGDADLVFGQSPTGTGRLYANDGTGRFTDVTAGRLPALAVPFDSTGRGAGIVASDIDLDGDQDLAFGTRILHNDGTGRFAATDFAPGGEGSQVFVDADRDGFEDLVFRNGQRYLNGGGFFELTHVPGVPARPGSARDVAVGDLDGDGLPDLVLAAGQLRILLQGEGGAYHDGGDAPSVVGSSSTYRVTLGDIDRDGDLDLLVNSGGDLGLFVNDGQAGFADVTATLLPPNRPYFASGIAFGDVDGDGDLDIAVAQMGWQSGAGQNQLFLNDGTGHFADVSASHLPQVLDDSRSLAFFDADGDGDLDLVFANAGTDRLCLNDGAGRFLDAPSGRFPVDHGWNEAVLPCDIDRDGDLDLLFDDPAGCRLYLNAGRARFADVTGTHLPSLGKRVTHLASGDLDRDGDLDLVVGIPFECSARSGEVAVLLNDGTGSFLPAGTGVLPPLPEDHVEALALFDADLDGDLDVFTGNPVPYCGGKGCERFEPGSIHLFQNRLGQLRAPRLPRLGAGFELEFHALGAPPSTPLFALPFLSSAQSWTPVPDAGLLRLDPRALLPLPYVAVPHTTGTVSSTIVVPNVNALVGAEVFGQALLVGWADRVQLSNLVRSRILR